MDEEYSIIVEVVFQGVAYRVSRTEGCTGTNHIANMPGTAKYMAKEIEDRIKAQLGREKQVGEILWHLGDHWFLESSYTLVVNTW